MENKEIRDIIRCNDLRHWQVAKKIGVATDTLCRWLREPLFGDRLKRVNDAIDALINEKEV